MMILNRIGLTMSAPALAMAFFGSSVAEQGAVLLQERNFSETVSLRDADSPVVRQFYVAKANSPRWDSINRQDNNVISVAPFRTPLPGERRTGSFIVDTTAPDRSEFASRILATYDEAGTSEPDLYLGLAAVNEEPDAASPMHREVSIGQLDRPSTGSSLAFVRFDINQWEVSDGVLTYDIDVSYWGKPAVSDEEPTALMAAVDSSTH